MGSRIFKGKVIVLSLLLASASVACRGAGESVEGSAGELVQWDTERLFRTVCDPFDPGSLPGETSGLEAELFYLDASQPQYSSVNDYFQYGHHADVDLFFSKINVPTTLWSHGFTTESGALLVNSDNQVLHEYFALKYRGGIKLGVGDGAGRYQFAILSDDGAILDLDDGTGLRTIVNNDGLHPTRMGCATEALDFTAASRLPMRMKWYQGPRYHISNILMWRKIPAGLSPAEEAAYMLDPQCGTQGNNRFFDYNQTPPAPTQNWQNLLNAGWRVLKEDNYVLHSETRNPCSEEWEIAGRTCFTETFRNTQRTAFTLFAPNVDEQYLRVTVNGTRLDPSQFVFDPVTHTVEIPGLMGVNEVVFDYCLEPNGSNSCTGLECGGHIGV